MVLNILQDPATRSSFYTTQVMEIHGETRRMIYKKIMVDSPYVNLLEAMSYSELEYWLNNGFLLLTRAFDQSKWYGYIL
jgi:hypothetical protein